MTDAEVILWVRLRRRSLNGHRFRRQHPIAQYIADFASVSGRLVIEVDGATHSSPAEIEYDRQRDAFLDMRGWSVLRVTNLDVYENLEGVLERIYLALPPPPLRGPPPP
jgi:very-short-patch-repair endonuclease